MRPRFWALALLVAAAAVAAFVQPGRSAPAQTTELRGIVGPGFTIVLNNASGERVSSLAPGTYTLVVDDRSDEHNFHLTGPGVDVRTEVGFVGTRTFTITVTDGTYTYVCDPHATSMKGGFKVT